MLKLGRREPRRKPPEFYDLDKIQAEPVAFRLNGKIFEINPLSALQFFEYTQAYARFHALAEKEQITADDLSEGYFEVFSSVCPAFTKKDMAGCSQQQAAVIFGIILDAVTGKDFEVDKKKTLSSSAMKLKQ